MSIGDPAQSAAERTPRDRESDRSWGVREAAASDVAALVELVNAAYVVEAFLVSGERIDSGGIAAHLARGTFLVADAGTASDHAASRPESRSLAGCVFLEPRPGAGYLGLLSVAPPLQGRGIGDLLLRAGEQWLRGRGCAAVEILVVSERGELFPWYEKRGYFRAGTRPFTDTARLLRPCHFVEMRKVFES